MDLSALTKALGAVRVNPAVKFATHPMTMTSGYSVISGLKSGRAIYDKEIDAIINTQQYNSRRMIPVNSIEELKDFKLPSNANEKLDELKSLLKNTSFEKTHNIPLDDHNIFAHPTDNVVELIPDKAKLVASAKEMNGGSLAPENFQELLRISGPSIAKNLVVGGITTGSVMYGPKVVGAIKDKIANNMATKEAAALVKQEIEKRAASIKLDDIINSVNTVDIVRGYMR